MNRALEKYLKDDWELVRTTMRFHYIRNRKKSAHLKGLGVQTSRIVRTWYEPFYLFFREWCQEHSTLPEPWKRNVVRMVCRYILDEKV